MDGNSSRDRYDDYGGSGYPGGPGYGYDVPGYTLHNWGAQGYGYGALAYGGAPGYGAPPTSVNATEEIERLRERLRMLEEAARQQQAAPVVAPAPNLVWRALQPSYSAPAGSHVGGLPVEMAGPGHRSSGSLPDGRANGV
jgi:hypothetical protein